MQLDYTRISVPVHPAFWLAACADHEKTLDTPEKHAEFAKNRYDLWPHLMGSDGRIHPVWDLSGWTGRIHATTPPIQSIPKLLRRGVAVPGKLIIVGDWRGCHARILGHHSQDPQLLQDLAGDVYSPFTAIVATAGVEAKAARKVVKAIVNARLNGAGEAKVGEMLRGVEGGVAVDVEGLLDAIRLRWPVAWAHLDNVYEAAKARWTISTPDGLEVIVPDDKRDRAHIPAAWLQATEARALRRLIAASHRAEDRGVVRLVAITHDGAVWEVTAEHAAKAVEAIRRTMEKALFPSGSSVAEGAAEVTVGPSWGQQDGSLIPPEGSPRSRAGWVGYGVDQMRQIASAPEPGRAATEAVDTPEVRFGLEIARIDAESEFGLGVTRIAAAKRGREAANQLKAAARRVRSDIVPFVERGSNRVASGFARADHVELAERLLVEIGALDDAGERTGSVVADRGAVWTAEAMDGLWSRIDDHDLRVRVQKYAGTPVGPKSRPLTMSHSDTKAVQQTAADRIASPEFFADVVPAAPFANGLLFSDGTFRAYSAADRVLADHVFPVSYDTNATCPRWLKFLAEVYDGEPDVAERIELLQRFMGAALFGIATRYQSALLLLGDGSNGKSVLLHAIESLFNRGSIASIPPQQLSGSRGEYYAAQLALARINIVTEMPERDLMESEAVKAAIAGDIITGRHPTCRPFSFRPGAAWIIACNRLPAVRDTSHGFWRRLRIVTHNRVFTSANADPELPTKLLAERAGIAAWAVRGGVELLREGRLPLLASSGAAVEDWRASADPASRFAHEHLEVDESERMPALRLYELYRCWCRANGYQPLNSRNFGERIKTTIASTRTSGGVVYRARLINDWRLHHDPNIDDLG